MRHYSERFKREVVKKVLTPGIQKKVICEKLGLYKGTVNRWIKEYRDTIEEKVENIVLDSIQPEEEEEIDIDSLLAEYERKDMSKNELNLEEAIDKIVEKGKLPVDYSQQEKHVMVTKIRNLTPKEHGMFFRRTGIHSDHIKLWEKELLQMAKKEVDKSDYIKNWKKKIKNFKSS